MPGTGVAPGYPVRLPDGSTLAAGTLQGIRLWDVASGEQMTGLSHPLGTVYSVAFSPDGKLLATAGNKEIVGARDGPDNPTVLRLWQWFPSPKPDR